MEETLNPKVGMRFDGTEAAWNFWRMYGGKIGFGVRKNNSNVSKKDKTKITSMIYVCSKEGFRRIDKRDVKTKNPRSETRTGCRARIIFKLISGKYEVKEFIEEHNHTLHNPEAVHMIPSQREISEVQAYEIELADDSGLKQKASFDLMSLHCGGRQNVGFTRGDAKNYLKSRRERNMAYGEASALTHYFQKQASENPSFFHAYQLDVEEQMTNVFWADAKMLIDYALFGEVVSLDTTFGTNKKNRPLAVFSGLNHHRGIVIFGAGLLFDETTDSFKWLFQTFLQANGFKTPLTVFTDQDGAMARALSEVMPNTTHGLCTWHLMKNATKHLAHLPRGESHILTEISRCMYAISNENLFEDTWTKMLIDHDVKENQWIINAYVLKHKWAKCYMKNAYTIGIRSTQLSESFNSDLKEVLNPSVDLAKFFKLFEKVVDEKRYNEVKAEYYSRDKMPRLRNKKSCMVKQVSEQYTPAILDLFQDECDGRDQVIINNVDDKEIFKHYSVSMVDQEEVFNVSFDASNHTIECSCKKFEHIGIICCHALKIYDINNVKLLPSKYIMSRWTNKARAYPTYDATTKEIEEDPKIRATQRFRDMSRTSIRISAEASKSEEGTGIMLSVMSDLERQLMDLHLKRNCSSSNVNVDINVISTPQCPPTIAGFRQKIGTNKKRRHKSCLEGNKKTKKKAASTKKSRIGASCSTPPEPPLGISFTELLMAPIDHHSVSIQDLKVGNI